ncbi:MAG: hypothetical protein FWG49_07180, partial [Leptospirales bacterium]|nr:hypothetical protein [Leptospirales bacterium]
NELQSIKKIAVSSGKILSDEIDCGSVFNHAALLEKIKSSYPADSIINIALAGDRDFLIENNFITELSEFFRGVKIRDISIPSLNVMIEENMDSDSLKGIFFQILNEKIDKNASNKGDNEMLAGIIFQRSRSNKSEGVVLCDF